MTGSLPLKRVARVRFSSVDKKSNEGEIPVRLCNYTDVYYRDSITRDVAFMEATATPNELREFSLTRDDVLITKDSESPDDIGIPSYVSFSDETTVCGYHLAQIRPDKGKVDGKYLFWWMTSDTMRRELSSRANGITRFGLKLEAIAAAPVRIPTIKEQRAIADFLDRETATIDALLAKKRSVSALLEERFRCQLDQSLDSLPGPRIPLGRFMLGITQGVSPQAEGRPALDNEWGLLRLSSVKFGRFVPSENKALPQDYVIDPRLVPVEGDLLVTRSNTPKYVGDACAVQKTAPRVLLCDLIYRVRVDHRLLPEFAAYALLTSQARHHLGGSGRGTSQSMVKLRGEDVRAVRIPDLPIDKQRFVISEIDRRRQRADEAIARLNLHIGLLAERRQALITGAVTGQMDIPSPA